MISFDFIKTTTTDFTLYNKIENKNQFLLLYIDKKDVAMIKYLLNFLNIE
jgi:hypothetical protein